LLPKCLPIDRSIRLAKLSEGQIVDGKLECLYHGWQFDGDGKCVKIPQVSLSPTFLTDAPTLRGESMDG
jgi:phenylpropionate dioxygenase-like ring-hydroxylating dioxygenase large terminal subunit